jgi:hypothetical protein
MLLFLSYLLLATSLAVESTANSFRSNNLGKFELTNIP